MYAVRFSYAYITLFDADGQPLRTSYGWTLTDLEGTDAYDHDYDSWDAVRAVINRDNIFAWLDDHYPDLADAARETGGLYFCGDWLPYPDASDEEPDDEEADPDADTPSPD